MLTPSSRISLGTPAPENAFLSTIKELQLIFFSHCWYFKGDKIYFRARLGAKRSQKRGLTSWQTLKVGNILYYHCKEGGGGALVRRRCYPLPSQLCHSGLETFLKLRFARLFRSSRESFPLEGLHRTKSNCEQLEIYGFRPQHFSPPLPPPQSNTLIPC